MTAAAILGKKIGMTRWFMEDGTNIPVTVIQAGPCVVTQVKTVATDGYAAVQLAFDDAKPRTSTQPLIGHDAKAGSSPKRVHRELRLESDKEAEAFALGQAVTVGALEGIKFVDVTGRSKGKGFQGTMVRWNFKGMCASHGTERKHRAPGSIGGGGIDRGRGPKLKKGKKMSGHMGDERVTVRSPVPPMATCSSGRPRVSTSERHASRPASDLDGRAGPFGNRPVATRSGTRNRVDPCRRPPVTGRGG
jgi:large subunit ribosomal protein L3